MKKQPLVGIVIVNWNKKDLTGNCLKSLAMTDYNNYKIIIVDNGSTDGSIEHLKKINKKIEVIKLKRNYGYTEGTNIGWKYAIKKLNVDYVCAMDNDIITVQKKWLKLIINELEKSPKNGLGSGRHTFPDGRLQTPFIESDMQDSNKHDTGKYNFVKEVSGFVGPGIVIKRDVIEKIGYYDENFFYGPNDLDYCHRAKKEGFKVIYVGTSHSVHIGSASGMSPLKDLIYRHQSEGMMIYSLRYGDLFEKTGMILRQFIRTFVTRKNPVEKKEPKNLLFHSTFPKRIGLFSISLVKALNNYKKIKKVMKRKK